MIFDSQMILIDRKRIFSRKLNFETTTFRNDCFLLKEKWNNNGKGRWNYGTDWIYLDLLFSEGVHDWIATGHDEIKEDLR